MSYARSRPELMGTYLIDINAMFFGMPMALFPAIAMRFGAHLWACSMRPLRGSVRGIADLGLVKTYSLAVTLAAGIWGVAIVAFGFAHQLWLALLCLAAAGAADMVSGLFRMTIWNQTIPDHLRGRLAGIAMVSYMSGPMLGNAEAGIVASLFTIRTSVVSGGVLCVLGTAALALVFPASGAMTAREGLRRKQREEAQRDELRLGRFQRQAELPQSFAQRILDATSILAILKAQHKVVDLSDQIGLASHPRLDHALEP